MELSWKWKLTDLENVEPNGYKVFSCFACGGGSSMGYKLAGYEVIGDCEIDKTTNAVYVQNFHPRYNFCMDIREFAKLEEYPEELYHLDILDGSPPCTAFSVAGLREEIWGVEKTFAEGNVEQRLDDLFFPFIDVAARLQPKVVIAENVKGLIQDKARGYVREIIKAFNQAGYNVQLFLINSATVGVPQKRERVFFVCSRKDLNYPKLKINFNDKPILFGEVRTAEGREPTPHDKRLLSRRTPGDVSLREINARLNRKNSGFTYKIIKDDQVCLTITASGENFRYADGMAFSLMDYIHVQSFPEDYNFEGRAPHFLLGMSVPPLVTARLSKEVEKQWLSR